MVDATKVRSIEIETDYAGVKKYTFFRQQKKNKKGRITSVEGSCAVLLGKNGSGKSTIARALSDGAEGVKFLDEDDNVISYDSANIHVFDDNFITKNFRRLNEKHLEPIILLGNSVQIQDDINDLEEKLNTLQEHRDTIFEEVSSWEKKEEEEFKNIKETLSKTGEGIESWKSRTSYYNEGGQYKNLRKDYIYQLIKKEPTSKSLSALLSEFQDKKDELNKAKTFEEIDWHPEQIILPFCTDKIEKAIRNVNPTKKPTDGDVQYARVRGSKISISELEERVRSIFTENFSFCPMCFQDLEEDYKKTIVDVINNYIYDIQNNESIQNLRSLKFEWRPEKQNLPEIDIQEEICNDLDNAWNNLYNICDLLNSRIQNKIDDPESEISVADLDPESVLNSIEKSLQEVQNLVNAYNSQGRKVNYLRSECESLNEELAVCEISADVSAWENAKKYLDLERGKLNRKEDEISSIMNDINKKKTLLKNEKEAADRINSLLAIVFGDNRILLEPDANFGYRVVNNNKDVPPERLSTGEQNILSLCYFFVKLAQNKKFDGTFTDNQIIVLDDPISSFDYDNKYGVIALIGYMAHNMFQEKSETRLLLMTHDPSVASDVSKIMKSSCNENVLCWKFQNDSIERADFSSIDEYRSILSRMCDFAMEENSVDVFPTANEVRRVWEAFLRFELGESNLSNVSDSDIVKSYFSDVIEESDFLNVFACRVLINRDSHSGSKILNSNFDLVSELSSDCLKRLIKEILCFMQIISPCHIVSRINEKDRDIKNLKIGLDALCNEIIQDYKSM